MSNPAKAHLVAAVRKFALEHYNEDGWDYVVESFSDEDLEKDLAGDETKKEAIEIIHQHVALLDSVRKDIQEA